MSDMSDPDAMSREQLLARVADLKGIVEAQRARISALEQALARCSCEAREARTAGRTPAFFKADRRPGEKRPRKRREHHAGRPRSAPAERIEHRLGD